jgi:hypothetical protein
VFFQTRHHLRHDIDGVAFDFRDGAGWRATRSSKPSKERQLQPERLDDA